MNLLHGWDEHIKEIFNKITKNLYLLQQIKSFICHIATVNFFMNLSTQIWNMIPPEILLVLIPLHIRKS